MSRSRRIFLLLLMPALWAGTLGAMTAGEEDRPTGDKKMYGLISKMSSIEGRRDELAACLLQGTRNMPGCLSYIVAKDRSDSTTIWVSEVWADQASHKAALSIPAVREAITKGKQLIARFDPAETDPVGGHGLIPVPTD